MSEIRRRLLDFFVEREGADIACGVTPVLVTASQDCAPCDAVATEIEDMLVSGKVRKVDIADPEGQRLLEQTGDDQPSLLLVDCNDRVVEQIPIEGEVGPDGDGDDGDDAFGGIPPCVLAEVESLEKWFSVEYGANGECRPCRLEPLASLYLAVLEKAGAAEEAKQLGQAYESGDILTVARSMDSIRTSVNPEIRQDLDNLDCFAQTPPEEQ